MAKTKSTYIGDPGQKQYKDYLDSIFDSDQEKKQKKKYGTKKPKKKK